MSTPWWTYNRIDNFGNIDPQGKYYKPDSNILTPFGYPIQAISPGVVTSVQRTSYGQSVVTIKLDNAFNALATHQFYEHMHDATVTVGQHVDSNTLIGHANYAGEGANLGFGFFSGDVYGSGSAWSQLQNDLKPGGAGLLNPVSFLNSAKGGSIPVGTGSPGFNPLDPIGSFWAIAQPTIKSWGEYIAIFLISIVLIAVGFFLLAEQQTMQVARKVLPI